VFDYIQIEGEKCALHLHIYIITCSLFATVSDFPFRPDTIVSGTYYMYHIPVLVFVQLN